MGVDQHLNTCLIGDCRDSMRKMIAAGVKVNCVVTSPPYWGLRDYKIPPSVWGGGPDCAHEWGEESLKGGGAHTHTAGSQQNGELHKAAHEAISMASTGAFCRHCSAWRGNLGLEPDYRMFIVHLVEVFELVRELLTDDGVCFMNLGDCYATGAGKVGDRPGGGARGDAWGGRDIRDRNGDRRPRGGHEGKHGYALDVDGVGPMTQPNRMPQQGLKAKDLCLIPHPCGHCHARRRLVRAQRHAVDQAQRNAGIGYRPAGAID